MGTEHNQKEFAALEKRLSVCEQTLYEVQTLLDEQRYWLDRISDEKAYKLAHFWMRVFHQVRSSSYERTLFLRWLKRKSAEESRFNYVYQIQRIRDTAALLLESVRRDPSRALDVQEREYQTFRSKRKFDLDLQNITFPQVEGLVSVVLPVYNGGPLLDSAIQSVLVQTYERFELIIVDDGSQDDTPVRIDQWAQKDTRILIVHQENQKIPRALNEGFSHARGEFLTWTSADNLMHPDFLERMVAFLQRNQKIALCYANMRLIDEKENPIHSNQWFPKKGEPEIVDFPPAELRLNVHSENLIGAAFMYRRAVKELIGGYDPDLYTVEDYDYWLRINDFFLIRHVDFSDAVYDYRLHSNSLTARAKELHINEMKARLMCIEKARQTALLSPLCWLVSPGKEASRWKEMALLQGHIVIENGDYFPPERCVAVSFEDSPITSNQNAATNALINCEKTDPAGARPYAFCVTVGEKGDSKIQKFRAADWETAFQAVHLFAKSKWISHLSRPLPLPRYKISLILYEAENTEPGKIDQSLRFVVPQIKQRTNCEIVIITKKEYSFSVQQEKQTSVKILCYPFDTLDQIWNLALYHAQGEYLVFLPIGRNFSYSALKLILRDFYSDCFAAMIFSEDHKKSSGYERFGQLDYPSQVNDFSIRRESLWEAGGFSETPSYAPEQSLKKTIQTLRCAGYSIGYDPRLLFH